MTNRIKFTSHCRIAAKMSSLLFFPARFAHARYSSRMIDRFLNWGDHEKPKSGKIKGRCQPPLQLQNNVRHFFKYCTNQCKSEANLQPITNLKDCPLAFLIDFSFFVLYQYKQESLFNDHEIVYQMIIFYCSNSFPRPLRLIACLRLSHRRDGALFDETGLDILRIKWQKVQNF